MFGGANLQSEISFASTQEMNRVKTMKNYLIFLLLACGALACNPAPPDNASSSTSRQPLAEAIKQPMAQARGAEQQIFDSADRQKQQAEAF
jgi:hypothetical protein